MSDGFSGLVDRSRRGGRTGSSAAHGVLGFPYAVGEKVRRATRAGGRRRFMAYYGS